MVDIPKVEVKYTPNYKHFHLSFISMRSKTGIQAGRKYTDIGKTEWEGQFMKSKEFSFHKIAEKPQTVHGFRKGKVVESRHRHWTNDFLHNEISDAAKQKTEDFSISGQKLNISLGDHGRTTIIPPREWVIEKSRTLPNIHNSMASYPTPINFFSPLQLNVREKLNVSTESLSNEKTEKEPESEQITKNEVAPKTGTDIDALPRLDDGQHTVLKGVTVSLQTDDYLYYNNDAFMRPTTSQNSRPLKYQPVKIITPNIYRKLPDVHEKKVYTSRENSRRKAFPTLRVAHNTVFEKRVATKQSLRNLSSSLPILTNPN